jgi:hypothetical protein
VSRTGVVWQTVRRFVCVKGEGRPTWTSWVGSCKGEEDRSGIGFMNDPEVLRGGSSRSGMEDEIVLLSF